MSVWAICACKNEADILPDTLCHILDQGVDHVLVADGMSTDGTRESIAWIEQLYPERVTMIDDPEPVFRQAAVMNRLARMAGESGAEWIIPFDADEYWSSAHDGQTLVEALRAIPPGVMRVYAPVYDYVDIMRRHTFTKLEKVAFRYGGGATLAMGNHDVRTDPGTGLDGPLVVRELQFQSRDHFKAKVRARLETLEPGLPPDAAGHYRRLEGFTDAQLDAEWDAMCAVPTVEDPIR